MNSNRCGVEEEREGLKKKVCSRFILPRLEVVVGNNKALMPRVQMQRENKRSNKFLGISGKS